MDTSPLKDSREGSRIAGLVIAFLALTGAVLFLSFSPPKHHKVTLKWQQPAPANGVRVVSYNVYRGTKAGGPYVKIADGVREPTYIDKDVHSKTAYFYVVTASSDSGKESRYSNEVIASVP